MRPVEPTKQRVPLRDTSSLVRPQEIETRAASSWKRSEAHERGHTLGATMALRDAYESMKICKTREVRAPAAVSDRRLPKTRR